MFPSVAYASGVERFVGSIIEHIINPVLYFGFVLAVCIFLWGVVEFIRNADQEKERTTGRTHIMAGLAGFAIILLSFYIIRVILKTVGVPEEDIRVENDGQYEVNIEDNI